MIFLCLIELINLGKFSHKYFFQGLCITALHKRFIFSFQAVQPHTAAYTFYQQKNRQNQQYDNNNSRINPQVVKNTTHITDSP